jgi:hypothetical protein
MSVCTSLFGFCSITNYPDAQWRRHKNNKPKREVHTDIKLS